MPVRTTQGKKYSGKQYYAYSTGILPSIVAAASPSSQIIINMYDFMVSKFTGSLIAITNQATFNPALVTIQIIITSLTEQIFATALPFNDVIGTAQLPSIVSDMVFPLNQTVSITFNNNSTSTISASLTMLGWNLLP